MEKDILQFDIEKRLTQLDKEGLEDLLGYLRHIETVNRLNQERQVAMQEIQTALRIGYSF